MFRFIYSTIIIFSVCCISFSSDYDFGYGEGLTLYPETNMVSDGFYKGKYFIPSYEFPSLPDASLFANNSVIGTATASYQNMAGNWIRIGNRYSGTGFASVTDIGNNTVNIDVPTNLGIATFTDTELFYTIDTINGALIQIANNYKKTLEPTGFVNRIDSFISFDDAYFRFYIIGTHEILIKGVSHIMPSTSIQITNTTGLYYIYYDLSAQIQASTIFPGMAVPLIGFVYWNSATGKGMLSDERHGISMDYATHEWLHENVGSVYESGMTGTFSPTSFEITAGVLDDEDNEFNLPLSTTCAVMYRSGSSAWVWDTTQSVYYKTVSGSLQYNNGNTLTPATNTSKYVAYWIYATNSPLYPFISFIGQREDSTLADAETNNKPELLSFGQIPSVEMKLIYRVILKNTATPTVSKVDDYRTARLGPSSSYNATKHSVLTDLSWELSGHNDQYFGIVGGIAAAATLNATAATVKDITITGTLVYGTPTNTPTPLPTPFVSGSGSAVVTPVPGGFNVHVPVNNSNTYVSSGVAEVTNSAGIVTIYAPDTILEGSGAVQIIEPTDHYYVISVPSLGGRAVSTIGNGVAKVWTITHNLGYQHVIVQINDNNTQQVASAEAVLTTTNTATLYFPYAPATNQYTVLCVAGGHGSGGGASGNHDDLVNRNTAVAHAQYPLREGVALITGDWTFNRAGAPFLIGANAHDQLVDGLNADLWDGHHWESPTPTFTQTHTPTPSNTHTPTATPTPIPTMVLTGSGIAESTPITGGYNVNVPAPTPQFSDYGIILGDGVNKVFHWYVSISSRWPIIKVREAGAPYHVVNCEVAVPEQGHVVFYFGAAPKIGEFKAYLMNSDIEVTAASTVTHNLNSVVTYSMYLSTGQQAFVPCVFSSLNALSLANVPAGATVAVARLSTTAGIGDAINKDVTFTHNLRSRDLVFSSLVAADGQEMYGELMFTNKNYGSMVFNNAPSLRQYSLNYTGLQVSDDPEDRYIAWEDYASPTPWGMVAGYGININGVTVSAWTPTPTGTPTPTYTPSPTPTPLVITGNIVTPVSNGYNINMPTVVPTGTPTPTYTPSNTPTLVPTFAFPTDTPTPSSNRWHLYDGVLSNLYTYWYQHEVIWTSSYDDTWFNLTNMGLRLGSYTLGTKIDLWGEGLYSLGVSNQTLDMTTDKRVSFSAPGAIKSVTIDVEHGGVEANYFTFGRTYTAFEGSALPDKSLFLLTSMDEIALKDADGVIYNSTLYTSAEAASMKSADSKFYFIPVKGTNRYVAFYQRY